MKKQECTLCGVDRELYEELIERIIKLQSEDDKLRKVVEAAREIMSCPRTVGEATAQAEIEANPVQVILIFGCGLVRIRKLEQALKELEASE